jgi:hypothetical protein
MSELLQEFVDSGNHKLRVDRAAGVIRGVKLLGLTSRNGRRYQQSALAEAVGLYEGAKVNINHPKGHPLSPRDYQDRLGVISGVRLRAGEGLFGDLRFNPKHALSEQLMWDAEHAPANVGLSHNVLARTSRQGDETVVEAITKVQSIDLVADPATTRGLFEQTDRTTSDDDTVGDPTVIAWDALSIDEIRLRRPELLQEIEQAHAAELQQVQLQLDQAMAREAASRRRERIVELLQEHALPLPGSGTEASRQIVSEQFLQTLVGAADDEAVRRLVEERAALVRSASRWNAEHGRIGARPTSRDQFSIAGGANGKVRDAKEFAAAISGR